MADITNLPARPQDLKSYGVHQKRWADCKSDADRWQWHAETYAFRRVYLGVPDYARASPCDLEGDWFDEELVYVATKRLRERFLRRFDRAVEEPWCADLWSGPVERLQAVDRNDERYRAAEEWRANPRRENP
jgi:hypothetical protein